MSVIEDLDDEEAYLYCLLQDESGLDQAEFLWHEPSNPDGCFRAWPFQWKWWRATDPLQIDQSARSVGKSLSICVRMFAFPLLYPGQEAVITAPELVHLEPIVSLVERRFYDTRLGREMLPKGRSAVTHRPFQMNFVNGSRIIGRIPQRDGKGVKGCVVAGTLILTSRGILPVEELLVGDQVLTHLGRWRSVLAIHEDINDCYEVSGQSSMPITVSCDHRFLGMENEGTPKTKRKFLPPTWHDVEFLTQHQVYWGTPAEFPALPIPDSCSCGMSDGSIGQFPIEFWWLVGRWLADGYVSMDKKRNKARKVHWVVHPKDQDAVRAALDACGLHYRVVIRDHSSADCIEVGSHLLYHWLLENFGQHAAGKRLPPWVLGMSVGARRSLLDGYLAGDGHVSTSKNRTELGTASRLLAQGLQFLAQSLGYSVNCSKVDPPVTEVMGVPLKSKPLTSYRLHLLTSGHPVREGQHLFAKVKSVKAVGKRKVYNPVIEEDHSYISGAIVSHNIHPLWLEQDESQDYPEPGWTELIETLKRGFEGAVWRAHGVTRGVRDKFYEFTQERPDNDWKVHRITAMHRPNWTAQERAEKIKQYGSRDHPDYRRNVLGLHGDATNPIFVLHRLMQIVDSDETSEYNLDEYIRFDIKDEVLRDWGKDIVDALDFPARHRNYRAGGGVYWVGMDVGYTQHPSEILVFVEHRPNGKDKPSQVKLLTRIHLERIAHGDQVKAILHTIDWYRPRAFAMDKTGLGLPLFQDIQERSAQNPNTRYALETIKGYNFSSKILVDFDQTIEVNEFHGNAVKEAGLERNVLEYATDKLRDLVDNKRLLLPWDTDLIAEYQGQTWTNIKGTQDLYGRRIYSKGKFHALDASRMAALGHAQYAIEQLLKQETQENVFDSFVAF